MPPSVLIVDDHADFRRATRDLLEEDGFRVVGEATTAARAASARASRARATRHSRRFARKVGRTLARNLRQR